MLELPAESVKVHVMVVDVVIGIVVVVTPMIGPSQLSVAVGAVSGVEYSH